MASPEASGNDGTQGFTLYAKCRFPLKLLLMKILPLSTFVQREWPDKGRATKGSAIVSLRCVGVYPRIICDLRCAKHRFNYIIFISFNQYNQR
jgi:hypothetical protein